MKALFLFFISFTSHLPQIIYSWTKLSSIQFLSWVTKAVESNLTELCCSSESIFQSFNLLWNKNHSHSIGHPKTSDNSLGSSSVTFRLSSARPHLIKITATRIPPKHLLLLHYSTQKICLLTFSPDHDFSLCSVMMCSRAFSEAHFIWLSLTNKFAPVHLYSTLTRWESSEWIVHFDIQK